MLTTFPAVSCLVLVSFAGHRVGFGTFHGKPRMLQNPKKSQTRLCQEGYLHAHLKHQDSNFSSFGCPSRQDNSKTRTLFSIHTPCRSIRPAR